MSRVAGEVNVPESIQELLGWSYDCSCGRRHSVELAAVSLRSGALGDLIPMMRQLECGPKVTVVCDAVTRQVAGDRVMRMLKAAGYTVKEVLLQNGAGGRPHADDSTLGVVEEALRGADVGIAVGSGTINDVVKLSSYRLGLPYICVATAPSMNGFASAIAAVMHKGVKRTVACHQPLGLVADLDVLAQAPHHLIASGLGDLESKPTSTGDFRLASLLRGDYYCGVPVSVVAPAEKKAAEVAPLLAQRDPEAIQVLTEALVISGISMKMAGTSGPASGGEHLISHYFDMTASGENRVEGWHGAQVGVATIVSSALYEQLRVVEIPQLDLDAIVAAAPSIDQMRQRIAEHYGVYADEVFAEYSQKHLRVDDHRRRLERIVQQWPTLWDTLDEHMRPFSQVRDILQAAGAPITVAQIGLSRSHMERALLRSREIRGRYTVLDFAAEMGLLKEAGWRALSVAGV